jgi:hypothetical protein
MDFLRKFITEHLDNGATPAAHRSGIVRLPCTTTRYLLFKAGHMRIALAATDIVAVTSQPTIDCEYFSAEAAMPARFRAVAKAGSDHRSYAHFSGSRFGLGPCKLEGAIALPIGMAEPRARSDDAPWIVASIATPPCLVLDTSVLCAVLAKITL